MMLVRVEGGSYEPMPVARYNEYVWDQPLHPERETQAAPEQRVEPAAEPQAPTHPNGNGYTNGNGNGYHQPVAPEPQRAPVAEPASFEVPVPAAAPATEASFDPDDRVTISKKAVALGIAIVLGLPFGGKIIGALGDGPAKAPVAAPAGAAQPAPLLPARSGFVHSGPDAVRYAVVLKNPNKGYEASGVTVSVVFHDARGRLVGRANEAFKVLPAGGATGVAGTVGVSSTASRMTVSVGGTRFQETTPATPFAVRGVRLSRSGTSVVVRAGVSGVEAVRGARVVVIHLDKAGRVVGGDFAFIDVPRSPGTASAVIPTAGVPRSVTRVEVYVLR